MASQFWILPRTHGFKTHVSSTSSGCQSIINKAQTAIGGSRKSPGISSRIANVIAVSACTGLWTGDLLAQFASGVCKNSLTLARRLMAQQRLRRSARLDQLDRRALARIDINTTRAVTAQQLPGRMQNTDLTDDERQYCHHHHSRRRQRSRRHHFIYHWSRRSCIRRHQTIMHRRLESKLLTGRLPTGSVHQQLTGSWTVQLQRLRVTVGRGPLDGWPNFRPD